MPKAKPATRTRRRTTPRVVEAELVQESFVSKHGIAILGIAVLGGILWFKLPQPSTPSPAPTPGPAPVIQPNVLTINALPALTAKLQGAPAKAKALAALFQDWAQTITVTGSPVTTNQVLRAVNTSLITMYVKAANVPKEPQVGAEIDACLKEVLGDQPGPLDINKARDAFNTLALALEQVK